MVLRPSEPATPTLWTIKPRLVAAHSLNGSSLRLISVIWSAISNREPARPLAPEARELVGRLVSKFRESSAGRTTDKTSASPYIMDTAGTKNGEVTRCLDDDAHGATGNLDSRAVLGLLF